jgi:hypothetical protein
MRLLEYIHNDAPQADYDQAFVVQRPDNLRVERAWHDLYVNPRVGLSEGRNAVVWQGPNRFAVGRVGKLRQFFEMTDKITGTRVVVDDRTARGWIVGPVIGMARGQERVRQQEPARDGTQISDSAGPGRRLTRRRERPMTPKARGGDPS